LQITNEIKTTEIRKGINVAIYGGASITDQAREIREAQIKGTPGRMQDMINRGLVNISQIFFVF
jgi:ATP-dependent RNA helicase DeaD